jgi:hypothetical protein
MELKITAFIILALYAHVKKTVMLKITAENFRSVCSTLICCWEVSVQVSIQRLLGLPDVSQNCIAFAKPPPMPSNLPQHFASSLPPISFEKTIAY